MLQWKSAMKSCAYGGLWTNLLLITEISLSQIFIQLGLETLNGWGPHKHSGQPTPALTCPYGEKGFPFEPLFLQPASAVVSQPTPRHPDQGLAPSPQDSSSQVGCSGPLLPWQPSTELTPRCQFLPGTGGPKLLPLFPTVLCDAKAQENGKPL